MLARDRAYDTLLAEIQSGALAPGTVLAEHHQAERLGVSRTPLREAIRALIADGLVTQQSPRVTVVTGFDAQHIRQLYAVRAGLEEVLVRSCAEAAARDRSLRSAFALLSDRFLDAHVATLQERDHYYALTRTLDDTLDRTAANPYLTSALAKVRTHLVRVRTAAKDNPARLAESAREHYEMTRAIALGDPDLAVSALKLHLHHARTAVLAALTAPQARSTTQ